MKYGKSWRERKSERTAWFFTNIYKNKLELCIACNGSGCYDNDGSPPCGCCNGTGKSRERDLTFPVIIIGPDGNWVEK